MSIEQGTQVWFFREKTPNESRDDGNIDDLFNTPETQLEQTIVRESIQNSLDAKDKDKNVVKINFKLVNGIKNNYLEKYLISLGKHLESSGKIDSQFSFKEDVDLLLIEDFNTTGLTGDFKNISLYDANNINSFWWNFNISNKSNQINKGGSRGIGRTVNLIASKCRSFLTFSKRSDDNKSILLGLSNLGHHKIGDKLHDAYGRFCLYQSQNKQIEPIELQEEDGKSFLQKIQSDRIIDDKIAIGTSNIILWPNACIDKNDLIKWVVINYSPIIVKKDLVVNVDGDEINSETIKNYVGYLDHKEANWLDFCAEVTSIKLEPFTVDKLNFDNFDIYTFFTDEQKIEFRNKINNGEILKFIIKCKILSKVEQQNKKKGIETEFNFFIKKTIDGFAGSCKFLRGNMPVMGEGSRWSYPANAYILAEHPAICSMLVDAEPPNHSSWSERTERFEKNYGSVAKKLLRFIKKFPTEFYDSIFNVSEEYDDVTFADAFPIEEIDNDAYDIKNQEESLDSDKIENDNKKKVLDLDTSTKDENVNDSSDNVLDLDTEDEPNYKIRKLKDGGFKFFANNKKKDIESFFPRNCQLTIGYSSIGKKRGIDSLSKLDIDLNNNNIFQIDNKNISELQIKHNTITAVLNNHNFELIIKGLDGDNRDAEIRIKDF